MIAVGFAMFIFGITMHCAVKPKRTYWDWRDWLTTVPVVVGPLVMAAGTIVWLWRVAP